MIQFLLFYSCYSFFLFYIDLLSHICLLSQYKSPAHQKKYQSFLIHTYLKIDFAVKNNIEKSFLNSSPSLRFHISLLNLDLTVVSQQYNFRYCNILCKFFDFIDSFIMTPVLFRLDFFTDVQKFAVSIFRFLEIF